MKLLIVSDRFVPAYIAQVRAFYKLGKVCNYTVRMRLREEYKDYISDDGRIIWCDSDMYEYKADIAIFTNISRRLPHIMAKLKENNCKCCYILHEPYPGLKEMLKEKNTFMRAMARTMLDKIICGKADCVLLPSEKSLNNYKKYYTKSNSLFRKFSLIFPEEACIGEEPRSFFSFIGGFTSTHNADGFVRFMKYAYQQQLHISFYLCTKSNVEQVLKDDILQQMIEEGSLVVQQGKPLTDEFINQVYGKSICVWNVYSKSTQSGVLGNAYMMGTPVIASHTGVFEQLVKPGLTGALIDNVDDFVSIYQAYILIRDNQEKMRSEIHKIYKEEFCYLSKERDLKKLVSDLALR